MNLNTVVPKYSIVIPMYNRENLISRALNSCLQQRYDDFEIVVVDDCSTDNSINVVKGFLDSRINLVRHEKNLGVGPARNTGIESAKGIWVILLDSDDELLPDALVSIDKHTQRIGSNISRLVFMYRLDSGGLSPSPPLIEDTWDYFGYIQWMKLSRVHSDFCNVIKKSAFEIVKFPSTRAYEALFHLDFAYRFLTRTCTEVVGVIHSDANNRSLNFTSERLLTDSYNNALQITELLERHGDRIKVISAPMYWEYVRGLITLWFLVGNRFGALQYALRYFPHNPFSKKLWIVIIFGLIDKRALAWLKSKATP